MAAMDSQVDFALRMYVDRADTYEDSWHPDYSERFTALIPYKPGDRALSLCCGTGLDVFLAADRVGESGFVVGVDVTPQMLAKAIERKEKDARLGPWISLHLHNAIDLDSLATPDVQKGSFDVILCSNAFVLFDDPVAVVRHWKEYLKPGGRFAIDVTHEYNLRSGLIIERVAKRLGVGFPANRSWIKSKDSFKVILEQEGLVVENITELPKTVGERSSYYTIDQADQQYDHITKMVLSSDVFGGELREEGRKIFREEWASLAVDGKIEAVDSLYIYIAKKPE